MWSFVGAYSGLFCRVFVNNSFLFMLYFSIFLDTGGTFCFLLQSTLSVLTLGRKNAIIYKNPLFFEAKR